MARMRYVVTGGTGFIGRRVVSQILAGHDDAEVWVLVRRESLTRFERLATEGNQAWGERAKALVGDLTAANLDLTDEAIAELGSVDHIVHCAAIYDITAEEADQQAANVEGTRAVIELARRLDATLHHVSSIAVAGTYHGEFTEDDFDVAQDLPTPYHQTKFEAELLVRSAAGLRYRVYRPAVVVGDSRTGEMDKIDGPYYFFGLLAKLAVLPRFTPIVLPDTGRTNIVPVDFVVEAVVALMHADGGDGQTFHLTAPKTIGLRGIYRGVAEAAGLPPLRGSLPGATATPFLRAAGRAKVVRNMAATQLGIPGEILDVVDLAPTFTSANTAEALRGTGITVPEFASYAPKLWRYWADHLDPDRARRDDPAGPLVGKHAIITGASSGIGRASAIAVAERGATVFALARNAEALDGLIAEIRAGGGQAHAFTCDVTDSTSVEHTVKDVLGRFGHVDYLVNNAGRSIRRSVIASTDRLHDYERVMAVNYFGAVRMVLALLPHWRERRRAGQWPEVQRIPAEQGGAGRVRRRGVDGDAVGPHHLHQHPHAAGEDADDRAVAAAEPDSADQRRTRRGHGGAGPGGKARAHRHPARHAGRLRQLHDPEAVASHPAPALPGLSGFSRRPRCDAGRALSGRCAVATTEAADAGGRFPASAAPDQACGAVGTRRALVSGALPNR
jgi:thioester reductase-like protein